MDSRVERILHRHDALVSSRANFENLWQDVAELILPGEAQFTVTRSKGEEIRAKQLDGTGASALRKFASILESLTIPKTAIWHQMVPSDDEMAENDDAKQALDALNRKIYDRRYSPVSGFSSRVGIALQGFGAFGTAGIYCEAGDDLLPRYATLPLASTYYAEDSQGRVNVAHLAPKWTARQIVEKYRQPGDVIPSKVKDAADRAPLAEFTVVQCIYPLSEYDGSHLERRGFRYASVHVCLETKSVVRESGFRVFPIAVGRDMTIPGEVYGRSPAIWALPQLRLLNEMKRSILRAGQMRAEPPILLQEDAVFQYRARALNYGAIGPNGEPLAQAMQFPADVGLNVDLLTMEQQLINDSFFVSLFQILQEQPNMTATEVLERAAEKGQLLGPTTTRLYDDMFGPLIEIELDIWAASGRMPELPPEFVQTGARYNLKYDSPIVRAQQAQEGVGIVRTFETAMGAAQVKPDIFDNLDVDGMIRRLAEINGVAAKYLVDREDVQMAREQRAEQQAAVQAAELAPGVARAAKDLQAA